MTVGPNADLIEALVHHFPQSGVKHLLRDPWNARDALRLATHDQRDFPALDQFDFAAMRVLPDTFIRSDFRAAFSDLLVEIPFLGERGVAEVYFPLEHKSQPETHAVPQVMGYVAEIYSRQAEDWQRQHGSLRKLKYRPVIPVVLYTGLRSWRRLKSIAELTENGALFSHLLPTQVPLFVSLPSQSKLVLGREGGALGKVLGLLQEREAAPALFRKALENVVRELEAQLPGDQNRLLGLLSYLVAVVYHCRVGPERTELRRVVEQALVGRVVQAEVTTVGKTIAQELRGEGLAEGRKEGRKEGRNEGIVLGKRQDVLRLLRRKFGAAVTDTVVAQVEATASVASLNRWLDRLLTAATLADVGIPPAPE